MEVLALDSDDSVYSTVRLTLIRAIGHDILDFCVRELVTLSGGAGGEHSAKVLHPRLTSSSLLMGRDA